MAVQSVELTDDEQQAVLVGLYALVDGAAGVFPDDYERLVSAAESVFEKLGQPDE